MAEIRHLQEKPDPDALLPGNLRVSVRLAGDELLTDGLVLGKIRLCLVPVAPGLVA